MLRVNIYISEDLDRRLALAAHSWQKAKAEVARLAMEEGLKSIQPKDNSADSLLKIAKLAEKLPNDPYTPHDLSINHDYYLWGGKKRSG